MQNPLYRRFRAAFSCATLLAGLAACSDSDRPPPTPPQAPSSAQISQALAVAVPALTGPSPSDTLPSQVGSMLGMECSVSKSVLRCWGPRNEAQQGLAPYIESFGRRLVEATPTWSDLAAGCALDGLFESSVTLRQFNPGFFAKAFVNYNFVQMFGEPKYYQVAFIVGRGALQNCGGLGGRTLHWNDEG